MKIEDQVANIELCKRLKELGVRQESYFYYCTGDEKSNGGLPAYVQLVDLKRLNNSLYFPRDKISALTVAELGEMLPRTLTWPDGTYALQQDFYDDGLFNIYYYANGHAPIDFTDEKEANARAKMLIFLIENGLMKNDA